MALLLLRGTLGVALSDPTAASNLWGGAKDHGGTLPHHLSLVRVLFQQNASKSDKGCYLHIGAGLPVGPLPSLFKSCFNPC